MKPDEKEILEDLIVTAHADARRKAEGLIEEKMKAVTAGLPSAARHEAAVLIYPREARRDSLLRSSELQARTYGRTHRRTGNRTADPIARAPAGAGAALGAARRVASDPQARGIARAARRGDAGRPAQIVTCSVCGNVDTIDPCTICADARRDPAMIVVVETVADLWALERAGRPARALSCARRHAVAARRRRARTISTRQAGRRGSARAACTEVILAVNATVDGQTTAHYITDLLAPFR